MNHIIFSRITYTGSYTISIDITILINTMNFFWVFNCLPLLSMTTSGAEFVNGSTLNRDEDITSSCPDNVSYNGNCSFNGNMCGWTNNESDQLDWKLKDGYVHVSTHRTGEDVRARLIGPSLCEQDDIDLCFQIKFKMDERDGGKMKFFIQCDKACNTNEWETTDWKGGEWQTAPISFKSPGTFKMIIEGHKYEDTWGKDSDFFIDDIRYFRNSCGNTSTPTTSSSVSGKQTQTEHLNYTMNTTQSRDTNNTQNLLTEIEAWKPRTGLLVVIISGVIVGIIAVIIISVFLRRRKKRDKVRKTEDDSPLTYGHDRLIQPVANDAYTLIVPASSNTAGNGYEEAVDSLSSNPAKTPHDNTYYDMGGRPISETHLQLQAQGKDAQALEITGNEDYSQLSRTAIHDTLSENIYHNTPGVIGRERDTYDHLHGPIKSSDGSSVEMNTYSHTS